MASRDLKFDVTALDKASRTFARMGAAVQRFERHLDKLDNKRVDVQVDVDTDNAEREIGSFARETRARLTAALRELPEVEIDANSDPAERAIANIRRRLAELADKTVGVDIGAEEAIAEANELQRQLDQLERTSPNVQVRADSARARAQLAELNHEVDRLDGRHARVRVDVDRGLDEAITRVSALGRAMSVVLPAAAAAATPHLASLGASAVAMSQSLYLIPAAGFAAGAGIATVVLGLQGFKDALDARGDVEAWAEAIKALAPNARFAATAIKYLGDSWGDMQQLVQQNLFQGAANNILQLSRTYLPIMRDALSGIATELARAGGEWTRFAASAQTTNDAAAGLENIRRATMPLGPIVTNLSAAFRDIGVVGSQFLPSMANGLARATGRWREFFAEARDSGQLAIWIQEGIDTVGQLGRIVGNTGSILNAVFSAAEQSGAGLVEMLERATSALKDFVQSDRGEAALVGFFRDVRGATDAALPGLLELGDALLDVVSTLNQTGMITAAAETLSMLAESAAPTVRILGELAAMVLPPLLGILQSLAPVLGPIIAAMIALSGAGKLAASAMALPASAIRSWGALRTVGESVRSFGRGARDTSGAVQGLGGRIGGLRGSATGALGAMRQFSGEMRLQRGLAAAQGVQLGRLGGVWAALETSQLSAARTAGELRAGYVQTSQAVQGFANRAGAAAQQVTTALGTRLASGVSRGVEAVLRVPQAVGRAAASLRQLPGAVSSAAATLRTGLGVAAITAAERLRALPAAASSAAATLRTAIGVAAIDTGARLRQLGTTAAQAGRSVATGLRSGAVAAAGALRQIPAAAAQAGTALATGLRNGVVAAGNAVRELPARVGSAISQTATRVASGMRAIPVAIQSGFSSLGGAVSGAIGHLGRFSGAVAGLGRTIGSGLMRSAGSLVSFLGGPWGVALAGAGVALSLLGQRQAEAAQKAQEHQAALDAVKGTLDSYSGAVTQATVNEKAKQLQQDGSLDSLKRLGMSTNDYTQATLGNQAALDRVVPRLYDLTRAGIEGSAVFQGSQRELSAMGLSIDDLTRAAMGYVPAQDKVNDAVKRSSSAGPAALASNQALAQSLMDAGGEAAILAQKLGISVAEVEQMQEATRTAATASQDFQNSLQGLGPAMSGIKDGVMPTEALANGMRDLAGSAQTAAQMAGEAAAELGGVDAGAKAAGDSMRQSRQSFVEAATAAGMTEEQAGALANQIGLIPEAAETNFRTNAQGVAAEMNTLNAQIDAIPAGKDVRVQSITDEARANLTALGFEVENMPDGTVMIKGNSDEARAALDQFIAGSQNREAQVKIGANSMPANQALGAVLGQIAAGNGQVTIDGNAMPAQQALSFVMGAIGTASGEVTINGQAQPAQGVLQAYIQAVNAGQGQVTINGNRIPADQVLQALIQTANGGVGTIQIDGNAAPANGKVQQAITLADGSRGTITIDGNQAPADGKTRGSVALANGSTGTITIDGNQAPANGKITATIQYADGSTGTVTINANDAAAVAAVRNLQRDTSSTHTITVREVRQIVQSRPVGALVRGAGGYAMPRAQGGYATPADAYAGGGLRRMSATRGEIVPARQPRIIGDRMRGDELFLPIDPSVQRNHDLLRIGANRMGYDLVPSGDIAQAAATGIQSGLSRVPDLAGIRARVQAAQVTRDGGQQITVSIGPEIAQLRSTLQSELARLRADVLFAGSSPDVVTALNRVREVLGSVRIPGVDAAALAGRTRAQFGMFGGGSTR